MWIARNKDEMLCLYVIDKPIRKENGRWVYKNEDIFDYCCCLGDEFPDLKWEDEPIEVELVKCETEVESHHISPLKDVGKYFDIEDCRSLRKPMNFYMTKATYTKEYYSVIRAFAKEDNVIIRFEYDLSNENNIKIGEAYIDCIATLDEVWNDYFKKIYVDNER